MRVSILLLLLLTITSSIPNADAQVTRGKWKLLVENAGVSAMHMALTHKNKVVIFDGNTAGASNLSQPTGECRSVSGDSDSEELTDCSAHSIEFDPASGEIRPLTLRSDTWCSSGVLLPDGSLLQLGGYDSGSRAVRRFSPCSGCDWYESDDSKLAVARWYSSSQLLPDGNVIVVGGRGQFSYEFYPTSGSGGGGALHELPFLAAANDFSQDNLYPFVHLLPDGNVFVFANSDSILLDPRTNLVVRHFPTMPGGAARNYPSSASSVLLPLDSASGFTNAEVMICGGASPFNFAQSARGNFLNASRSCGRLNISDSTPSSEWRMFDMPSPRIMGDMVLLPPGDVLVVNGAHKGNAGWRNAADPAFVPLLYKPFRGEFQELETASRPRLHHSAAILLPDASVLVGGSNPNTHYSFDTPSEDAGTAKFYPTDLSLEAFLPPYLDRDYAARRPKIVHVSTTSPPRGAPLSIRFSLRGHFDRSTLVVALIAPPVAGHASSMGQRMLRLDASMVAEAPPPPQQLRITGQVPAYDISTTLPATAAVAPSGYYMLFVSHAGLPSHAAWLRLH